MSDISVTEDPIGAFKRWLAEAEKIRAGRSERHDPGHGGRERASRRRAWCC